MRTMLFLLACTLLVYGSQNTIPAEVPQVNTHDVIVEMTVFGLYNREKVVVPVTSKGGKSGRKSIEDGIGGCRYHLRVTKQRKDGVVLHLWVKLSYRSEPERTLSKSLFIPYGSVKEYSFGHDVRIKAYFEA